MKESLRLTVFFPKEFSLEERREYISSRFLDIYWVMCWIDPYCWSCSVWNDEDYPDDTYDLP